MAEELTLEQETELEDRLDKLAELLVQTKPAEIDLLIEKHRKEIARLKRCRHLLEKTSSAAGGKRPNRLREIKAVFVKNANQFLSIPAIAEAIGCPSNLITGAMLRFKEQFEKKDKTYRLKNLTAARREIEEE
jgi:hypothetical protein